jgi:hypothetical protein
MKYAVEMGSSAVIYIPSFIKIGSGVQKRDIQTHRQRDDLISLCLFLQTKESKLKTTFITPIAKREIRQDIKIILEATTRSESLGYLKQSRAPVFNP